MSLTEQTGLYCCVHLGSYYTYWSYHTCWFIFFLIEPIIGTIIITGWSQFKYIVLVSLLPYQSSYYTYWLENIPPFRNICMVDLKNIGWNINYTSTYNRNLRVLLQFQRLSTLHFRELDGARFSPSFFVFCEYQSVPSE